MRERVWDAMLRADMNARYWKLYETRVTWIEKVVRVFVILSSVVSLVAWGLKDEYLPYVTAISAISAFLVVVIAPALGLDGYSSKIQAIKQAWIAMRLDYENLWSDVGDCDSVSWKRRWKTAKQQDLDLEQGGVWTPVSTKLVRIAQEDTEKIFVPSFECFKS